MANDDLPKLGGLIATSALAAGGALALAAPGAAPLALAAAILPNVAGVMTEKVLHSRLKKFFSRFAKDEATFDSVEARLQAELLTDPHLAQTIWSAVRTVLDVLDDSVVPALGALAVEYQQQKKPADSFFRGVTGILAGLSADEFTALREFVVACDRFGEDDDPLIVHANSHTGKIEIAHSNVEWIATGTVSVHSEMLFRLLKAHGISSEASTGRFGEQSGPAFLSVRRDTVARLVRIFAG